MPRYLITQSLLSSWQYVFDCAEGCEESAMDEFVSAINRLPCVQSEAMLNGIAFENEVYKVAGGYDRLPHPLWENGIQSVAKHIQGAPVQVSFQKEFSIGGYDFLLYGIADSLHAGHIFDVKYTNKSLGYVDVAGKHLNSPQHSAYLYGIDGAVDFTYLLSDGEDVYTEHYTHEITRPFPEIVHEFISSITSMGLLDIYKEKWLAK